LFRTYPGVVDDPSKADLFVVPYAHAAHCMMTKPYKGPWCSQLDENKLKQTLLESLEHYPARRKRHLFFFGDSLEMGQPWFGSQPLVATYGPRREHVLTPFTKRERDSNVTRPLSPRGHLLVPPVQPDLSFQPSFLEQELQQPHLQRDLSFVYVAAAANGKNLHQPRKIRRKFLSALTWMKKIETETHQNSTVVPRPGTIGGLPFVATSNTSEYSSLELYALYRRSIFCPVLAGDTTWQRRFFDVVACGCIPVVVSYELTSGAFRGHTKHYHNSDNNNAGDALPPVSWFARESGRFANTYSVQESYPFVDTIDYASFVVESMALEYFNLTAKMIVTTIESLLNEPGRVTIRKKQEALERVGRSFVYGVGPDAHRTCDAFAHLVESLRAYLDGLGEEEQQQQQNETTKH